MICKLNPQPLFGSTGGYDCTDCFPPFLIFYVPLRHLQSRSYGSVRQCSQFEVGPGVSILVDSISLALVRGSTIDYATELIGSQFAIKNNPQAKGAGCGCGVSWEPAI